MSRGWGFVRFSNLLKPMLSYQRTWQGPSLISIQTSSAWIKYTAFLSGLLTDQEQWWPLPCSLIRIHLTFDASHMGQRGIRWGKPMAWLLRYKLDYHLNPRPVVKRLPHNPVLWGPHGSQGVFWIKLILHIYGNHGTHFCVQTFFEVLSTDFCHCRVHADPAQHKQYS